MDTSPKSKSHVSRYIVLNDAIPKQELYQSWYPYPYKHEASGRLLRCRRVERTCLQALEADKVPVKVHKREEDSVLKIGRQVHVSFINSWLRKYQNKIGTYVGI